MPNYLIKNSDITIVYNETFGHFTAFVYPPDGTIFSSTGPNAARVIGQAVLQASRQTPVDIKHKNQPESLSMLKTILSNLYFKALSTREPQNITLSHGLGILVTIDPDSDKCILRLIRFWTKFPSEVELETIVKAWPYPVIALHTRRLENGRQRILEIDLPVQLVLA